MVRDTSAEAYWKILEDGLLANMALDVYGCLFKLGPLTGAELDEHLRGLKGGRGHYHKRLSELRDRGVVRECEKRECRVTGQNVITWDVTSALPLSQNEKIKRRKPKESDIKETLALMRGYYRDQQNAGTAPPSSFIVTMQWLASFVRSGDE